MTAQFRTLRQLLTRDLLSEDVVVTARSVVLGAAIIGGCLLLTFASLAYREASEGDRAVRTTRNDSVRSNKRAETSGLPGFTAVAPPATKTTGALLFEDLSGVAKCFERAFAPSTEGLAYNGFSVCEASASVIIPVGSRLEILEKHQPEYVARVKVLDGSAKDEIGFVHEAWIAPSPWSGTADREPAR